MAGGKLAYLLDGDAGLMRAFDNVEFVAPAYQGDYLRVTARLLAVGRTSRRRAYEAHVVARAHGIGSEPSHGAGLDPPLLVARATGVAEYQTLTTADSLAIIPQDAGLMEQVLTAVGDKLSLTRTTDKLALPHVYLKLVQLLEFRGLPLAKLSYLSPDLGPISLCIIANGRDDAGFAYEEREGSNIVYWTWNGRGYMLFGKAPREELEAFAADLASRVA
jgi:hypothetical protein